MNVNAYLMFPDNCEDAIRYYGEHLGAKLNMLMRYADAPPDASSECNMAAPDKVMYANFSVGDTVLMASDAPDQEAAGAPGVWLSLAVDDEAQAARCFDALSNGGVTVMPLGPTFYAHQFGMCTDRFGVSWMVIVPREEGDCA